MQFNATLKTKIGSLHFELINDATDIKATIEHLTEDDYNWNESKLGEAINQATKLLNSLSYFKNKINEFKNSRIETAQYEEVG